MNKRRCRRPLVARSYATTQANVDLRAYERVEGTRGTGLARGCYKDCTFSRADSSPLRISSIEDPKIGEPWFAFVRADRQRKRGRVQPTVADFDGRMTRFLVPAAQELAQGLVSLGTHCRQGGLLRRCPPSSVSTHCSSTSTTPFFPISPPPQPNSKLPRIWGRNHRRNTV